MRPALPTFRIRHVVLTPAEVRSICEDSSFPLAELVIHVKASCSFQDLESAIRAMSATINPIMVRVVMVSIPVKISSDLVFTA